MTSFPFFSITESEQDQAVDDSPPDGVSCCDQIHFKIHTFLWKWTFPATILICEAPDFHYIRDVPFQGCSKIPQRLRLTL